MSRFVSCTIILLGFALIPDVAPAQDTSTGWKKDFEAFIDVLSVIFIKQEILHSELKEKFEGQQVSWTGQFTQVSVTEKGKVVWIKMPAKTVTLSNGEKAQVYTLWLLPKENNLKKWDDAKVGDTVHFKTILNGDPSIPAVYVGQILDGANAGKYEITIRTDDAELVEVIHSGAKSEGLAIGSKASRVWLNREGKSIEAEFIQVDSGNVTLRKTSDGKTYTLPLEKLSDEDQIWVKRHSSAPTGDSTTDPAFPKPPSKKPQLKDGKEPGAIKVADIQPITARKSNRDICIVKVEGGDSLTVKHALLYTIFSATVPDKLKEPDPELLKLDFGSTQVGAFQGGEGTVAGFISYTEKIPNEVQLSLGEKQSAAGSVGVRVQIWQLKNKKWEPCSKVLEKAIKLE